MAKDITNQVFGKLTAIKFSHKAGKQKKPYWLFKCDCGKEKIIPKFRVTEYYTKSCGCLMRQNSVKHGLSGGRFDRKPEYRIWSGIKRRCLNPKDAAYKNYGGRGIKICDRWINSFENFFNDLGERTSPEHSIDRINNDGNYELTNCRWATPLEQGRNKRNIRLITINDQTKCLTEWIEFLGLDKNKVSRDLYERKLPILEALKITKNNQAPSGEA